jgi:transposase-like protein
MPAKARITCKYDGCTEPRHVWPGGTRASYCLAHYNLVNTRNRQTHRAAAVAQARTAPPPVASVRMRCNHCGQFHPFTDDYWDPERADRFRCRRCDGTFKPTDAGALRSALRACDERGAALQADLATARQVIARLNAQLARAEEDAAGLRAMNALLMQEADLLRARLTPERSILEMAG